MNITIFGAGYVGLVSAACFAELGHTVMCIDKNKDKIRDLSKSKISIYEPGLGDMIKQNQLRGELHFSCDDKKGVEFGDIIFVAVGTPPNEDGSTNLEAVFEVANSIAAHMNSDKVIVNKSTSPVGTVDILTQNISQNLSDNQRKHQFAVCANPEFLREGSAINDFMDPDRIIIGTNNDWDRSVLNTCYKSFQEKGTNIIYMDVRSAELTKYVANSMLATRISFMNEIANLAELLNADISSVKSGIASDPRIGAQFLSAGCGYGGSCLPKDVKSLKRVAELIGYNPQVLAAVESVNENQKKKLYSKLAEVLGGNLTGKTIAIWGLSFKPGTDDIREAPSRVLMELLWQNDNVVQAFDPQAMPAVRQAYEGQHLLTLHHTPEQALENADALVICTEWEIFKDIDYDVIVNKLKNPIVVDGRNILDPEKAKACGLNYSCFGRFGYYS